jgi:thioredoxin reductase (NADPH)
MDYELAVIGAGPAGYSAGIYAVRAGIKTVVFDTGAGGGLAAISPNIENYAGFTSITGAELTEKMKQHAEQYADIHFYEQVTSIQKVNNSFLIDTSEEKKYEVGAVLLAMGTEHRKLTVPGADTFLGMGVSYCATCDGFFFKDKTVAVVGGGNSALIEAIFLKQIGCKKVYLIHRRNQLRAEEAYEQQAKKAGVEFLLNKIVKQIKGEQKVESILLEDKMDQSTKDLSVNGIFISIGVIPQSELAKKLGVTLDDYGYINVDSQLRTNIKGVYAAGDIRGGLRQIITAAADGAVAALTATEVLGKQYPY